MQASMVPSKQLEEMFEITRMGQKIFERLIRKSGMGTFILCPGI